MKKKKNMDFKGCDKMIDDIHTNTIKKTYLIVGIDRNELDALESDDFEEELTSNLESDYEYFFTGYFNVDIQELNEDKEIFIVNIEAEEYWETNHSKDFTLIESMLSSIEVLSQEVYELKDGKAIKTQ